MKQCLITLAFVFTYISGDAQTQLNDSNIAKTMQRLSDTTVIIQYPSIWSHGPFLLLLSKTGDTITAYEYKRPEARKVNLTVPSAIRRAMYYKDLTEYMNEQVSINRYFVEKAITLDKLRNLWNDVLRLNLWNMKDDAIEGSGCPTVKGSNLTIDDAGGIYILLISKAEIKPLNFYAPEEFEKFCPGRKGRQTAIKLSDLMVKAFRAQ
ncbi:hypothetical protein [Pedobacter agri]|uniref:hypothetical protein n=1 Tax=Pedobacter agri TaxID=454586 RepID=UPI002930BABB|nr:hypothetical protein [Pedobacter agri]